ncbi:PadR family transcriptional regulator [Actinomadura madurae]|nr:PadR family transcriptional regulator [Actinomadura madurae]URN10832.1 PadR family transcriptional regulator [Actinomadura madurae]
MVRATCLPTGTVYPIITRLEQAGWISSRWETPNEQAEDGQARPRRRYYQLTHSGAENARNALAIAHSHRDAGPIQWNNLRPQPPGAVS